MISLKQKFRAGSDMEAQSIVGDHISVLAATAVGSVVRPRGSALGSVSGICGRPVKM